MGPIAASLDILHGEQKTYFGLLLLTIASVLNALASKRLTELEYCRPLLETVIEGVHIRYQHYNNVFLYTSLFWNNFNVYLNGGLLVAKC